MKKYILFAIIIWSVNINAQTTLPNPVEELGVWYMYNGSHRVSEKFSIKSMAHFRFFEFGEDMQQFIGRFGTNYKINKTFGATLGYAYLNTDTSYEVDGGTFGDHRIYEDLLANHNMGSLKFAHRLRAEQLFFRSLSGHFIRYHLGLSYPLSNIWSTYLFDEVFFDFTGQSYNQNWLGAGVKYQLSKVVKLQLGYMSINTDAGQNFDRIQMGIAISTDHRKKSTK